MMETLTQWICLHAAEAHWIIFILLLLAGLNVPLSEDVLLLCGGAIVGTCVSKGYVFFYFWMFFGCWFSAWEAYALGRWLGPKLYGIRWFKWILTPKKVERLERFYEEYGIWTFLVGRFIPGGVRQALFMTSGMGKMPFKRFLVRDGLACFISSNVIFYLGYAFGQNYRLLIEVFHGYNLVFLIALIILVVLYGTRQWLVPKTEDI